MSHTPGKFVKVKSYHRGLYEYPVAIVINVEHIVLSYESEARVGPAGVVKMCVYIDTTTIRGLVLDCTLGELMKEIEG